MSTALSTASVAQSQPPVKIRSVDYYELTQNIPLAPEHDHDIFTCTCPLCMRPAKVKLTAWYKTLPDDVLVQEFRSLRAQRAWRWCRQGAFVYLRVLLGVMLERGLVRASWED